ncbi:MAG TPA: 1-(5-phosphoribosyl)-5-[(5-phosphoribosylamino)methylideneamino]imidazole-4-carboxamide isomerase [Anaerovoracaceae bacterium]|nr:1-(5-phosphoribosyl)-5-[(5-phosphoribosylamino)methylideneamino]imidazole-4-carboxamide isomerase [Anaerovoracaceae bacterium]
MSDFTVYPAIDLRNGMVIRLKYGDPLQQTTFSNDPSSIAIQWKKAGAKCLHVVNLDAAFGENDTNNLSAIKKILSVSCDQNLNVQVGGGIRSLSEIESFLSLGVKRVILGTTAVKNPDLVKAAVIRFGSDRVIVAVDARDGMVHTHGWMEKSGFKVLDFVSLLNDYGINTIIYTDISRDGAGGGINIENTLAIYNKSKLQVIASGGIFEISDVIIVKKAGFPGVVIGKALYTGSLDPVACFELQEGG